VVAPSVSWGGRLSPRYNSLEEATLVSFLLGMFDVPFFVPIFHWMLDVGCWMLDVGCWMLDVGSTACGGIKGLCQAFAPGRRRVLDVPPAAA
jgi:hypothetical protein